MEETAALLGSTAIKQRLAGVTELLERLRRPEATPRSAESMATLIPHVLPCLRDHNSKIALSALEILELLVTRVAETTLRSYFKLLWVSIVERLGDNKLPVREKAVDVVVEISVVLDIPMILEKLKVCMQHKNWRTREQSLHAVWRCLERHNLFKEKKDVLLDDVLKLLEDSSKDVRDAAVTALENFYTYIGPSLLSDLEYKKIRSAHMKTLADRFERIPAPGRASTCAVAPAASNDIESSQGVNAVPEPNSAVPDELTSILSTYDLQVSSSSSMARYLASVRSRTQNEAKTADPSGGDEQSLPRAPSTAPVSVGVNDNGISERDIQKQLGVIFDKLQLDNNWSVRVDGLKMLQKLAGRCSKAPNSDTALPFLSQGIRSVRERLCEQVIDLRSSVSREACQAIQMLANTLRDDFNGHAEYCLGNLLKATYVTIQVISTAADTTVRSMIESTNSGYVRVIPKLIECVKTRNQVLRYNAVCFLTLTLQRWSQSFLAKHSDMFAPILPAILQDAVGDVRAQSRKCYWSYHHLFPDEANDVFARLDASTQRNLRDDPSRYHASDVRQTDWSSVTAPASQGAQPMRPSNRTSNALQPPISAPAVLSSVPSSGDNQPMNSSVQRVFSSGDAPSVKLPRRVLGTNSSSTGGDITEENAQNARMLSQGPMRVGLAARQKTSSVSKDGPSSINEKRKTASAGPLRVWNAPKPSQTASSSTENLLTSRQEPSTVSYHTSSQNPAARAQRIQLPAEVQEREAMNIDDGEPSGPKRLPLASSMPSPTTSNVSSTKTNSSSTRKSTNKDSGDIKSKSTRATTVKSLEQENLEVSAVFDQLDEALRNIDSKSWSARLEAAEYIGRGLQKRLEKNVSGASNEQKVNNRIVTAFIKHLSDPHYRVSQEVLKHFLPILKLSNDNQRLIPLLKTILPKLFQKFIDTKESVRVIAKENLEYIAFAVESSTLAAVVISMLGDGSNMKVKAAMCHYLRELLPEAGSYMKQGTNNSHMRSFLIKIALLMDADVPVSVASACGELVSVAAKLYGADMETALGLLPPSKRAVVSKVLKSRKIILNFNSFHRPPTPPQPAPQSARSRDGDNDNQTMDVTASKPERSRKRPESPSVSSSSPPRQNSQKRMNTTASQDLDGRPKIKVAIAGFDEGATKVTQQVNMDFSTALFESTTIHADQHGAQLEDILHVLEQNNSTEVQIKNALYKTVHFIETGSPETWNRCFGRLLLLLLDVATDKVYAWKVLKKLVETQPSRAQMFFELLLQRLIDAMNAQVDVARHLMERILHELVRNSSDKKQTLATLVPLISSTEPPALQVVLCLVKLCLESCERGAPQETEFLLKQEVADGVLGALTRCLSHASSKVRKHAVDCLVVYHFATKEDNTIMNKYLSAALDDTRQRLVGIFIDRANMERHHIGLSS